MHTDPVACLAYASQETIKQYSPPVGSNLCWLHSTETVDQETKIKLRCVRVCVWYSADRICETKERSIPSTTHQKGFHASRHFFYNPYGKVIEVNVDLLMILYILTYFLDTLDDAVSNQTCWIMLHDVSIVHAIINAKTIPSIRIHNKAKLKMHKCTSFRAHAPIILVLFGWNVFIWCQCQIILFSFLFFCDESVE